jgi:adenylate cyclase class 1
MNYSQEESAQINREIKYEYCYVQKKDSGWEILKQHKNLFKQTEFLELQVIGHKLGDRIMFKVYCENKEYSTMEHGDSLYRLIAEHIVSLRKNKATYPIYITDLDLSRSLIGNELTEIQTIHYLNYKKYFENKLNAILDNFV